ncbi:MAG: ankyrin repeat domain-containing protein [Bacteroidia bacterium]|jgi:hypothetical protein|nr:ankyrin repeat domain-containing protein [Bacteroidia bacterium]
MKNLTHPYFAFTLAVAAMFAVSCSNPVSAPNNGANNAETNAPETVGDTTKKNIVQTSPPESLPRLNTKPVQSKPVQKPAVDLHTAVISDNIDAVKQHIKAGSELNGKDPVGGSTPLITAALFGKTEIARLLIDAGADLNARNNDGSTALFTAAFFCRTEIVKNLLDRNADKSIRNKYGQTAFEAMQIPFDQVKPVYDMLGNALAPMGLTIDYTHIEQTRPLIAEMLK